MSVEEADVVHGCSSGGQDLHLFGEQRFEVGIVVSSNDLDTLDLELEAGEEVGDVVPFSGFGKDHGVFYVSENE